MPNLAEARPETASEILRLWPGRPPGAPERLPQERIERIDGGGVLDRVAVGVGEPYVTIVRPPEPNGAVLLLIPGGGYVGEWFDKEGHEIAGRFAPAGVTSAVLRYRLPGEGWAERALAPVQDAQRAVRLIRARASALGVDPSRLCAMGFSAGGHLAAMLVTRRTPAYAPIDSADAGPTRPDLAALGYPVIDVGMIERTGGTSTALLGGSPRLEEIRANTPSRFVDETTPPLFIVHAADDPLVPVEHSLGLAAALRARGVPVELHLFEEGGHGFGVRETGRPVATWPELFLAWARRHGLVDST
jgi:acetyl esterase/lipase